MISSVLLFALVINLWLLYWYLLWNIFLLKEKNSSSVTPYPKKNDSFFYIATSICLGDWPVAPEELNRSNRGWPKGTRGTDGSLFLYSGGVAHKRLGISFRWFLKEKKKPYFPVPLLRSGKVWHGSLRGFPGRSPQVTVIQLLRSCHYGILFFPERLFPLKRESINIAWYPVRRSPMVSLCFAWYIVRKLAGSSGGAEHQ